jgi:hypothetical protein
MTTYNDPHGDEDILDAIKWRKYEDRIEAQAEAELLREQDEKGQEES